MNSTSNSSDNSQSTLTHAFTPTYRLITDLTKTTGIPFFLNAHSNTFLVSMSKAFSRSTTHTIFYLWHDTLLAQSLVLYHLSACLHKHNLSLPFFHHIPEPCPLHLTCKQHTLPILQSPYNILPLAWYSSSTITSTLSPVSLPPKTQLIPSLLPSHSRTMSSPSHLQTTHITNSPKSFRNLPLPFLLSCTYSWFRSSHQHAKPSSSHNGWMPHVRGCTLLYKVSLVGPHNNYLPRLPFAAKWFSYSMPLVTTRTLETGSSH